MNIRKGIININDELIIDSNYTFDQFKKTSFYRNQDGIRVIYLDDQQHIDGRKYIVSLFFRNNKIYMVSLICNELQFAERDERSRKKIHDKILEEWGILNDCRLEWGSIESAYDARSNISSINISYN